MARLKPFEIETKVTVVGILVVIGILFSLGVKFQESYDYFVPKGNFLNWRFFAATPIVGIIITIIVMNFFWKKEYHLNKKLEYKIENLENQLNLSEKKRMTDVITGIPNSTMMEDDINEISIKKAQTVEMQLILIDIKNFKEINRRFGYLKGDAVLRLIAQNIYKSMRRNEDMYKHSGAKNIHNSLWKRFYRRYPGGDEFVFIIEGNQAEAIGFVNRLVTQFQALTKQTSKILNEEFPLSFCCGISPLVYKDKFKEALGRVEDCFMIAYESKKNFSICWHPSSEEKKLIIEKQLYHKIYEIARENFEVLNIDKYDDKVSS